MALTQINQTFELREILLKDRPNALYKISSKATVPVLHNIDGNIIDESIDIMKWALNNGSDIYKIDKQLSSIKLIDKDFKFWLDKYKYYERFPQESQYYYREKASAILTSIEKSLNDNSYILGSNFQLVDIAIFPLIRQFINVDIDWFEESFKNIYQWYKKINESSIFNSVMKKYEIWEEGKEPLLINFFELDNTEKLILQTP
tara:strand:+ start:222 stop:830 length:609 start_codon:yes stop_codon:yes gene_type:complete